MHADDDTIESAKPPKPPKPPKPHDPERRKRFLLHAVAVAAVAAVATAAFTGFTAWEIHQDRVNSKAFYCFFATTGGDFRTRDRPGSEGVVRPPRLLTAARKRHCGSGTYDTH